MTQNKNRCSECNRSGRQEAIIVWKTLIWSGKDKRFNPKRHRSIMIFYYYYYYLFDIQLCNDLGADMDVTSNNDVDDRSEYDEWLLRLFWSWLKGVVKCRSTHIAHEEKVVDLNADDNEQTHHSFPRLRATCPYFAWANSFASEK